MFVLTETSHTSTITKETYIFILKKQKGFEFFALTFSVASSPFATELNIAERTRSFFFPL